MLTAFLAVFLSVFLAELGDKTQIATLLFATDKNTTPFIIFCASAGALVLSSAIAVLAGTFAKAYLQTIPLKLISGIIFIIIGAFSIYGYFVKQ